MARRDNQGIQIAMIVFILTTLLFMVTTYFGYSSTTALKGEVAQLTGDLQESNSQRDSAVRVATNLKTQIGLEGGMDDSAAEAAVQEAVTTKYGQGLPPENQNFVGIAEHLTKRLQDLSGELATVTQTNKELRQQMENQQQEAMAKIQQWQEAASLANSKQTEIENELTKYRSESTGRETAARDAEQQAKQNLEQLAAKTASDLQALQTDLARARRLADERTDELNSIKKETPDQYDGRVLGSVPATKTVVLNVGRADGVRPKITFGIYDAEDSNVRTAKKKATVEVTKVLTDHSCEAKVTVPNLIDPIVRGDFIYSAIWSPGSRIGIALVGKMDFDKDGQDDRAEIRNLIRLNGGKVDAEDVDGKVQGEVTVNTRYVVVGEAALDASENPAGQEIVNAARELSVERMSLEELLDLMGYAGRARTESFQGVLRPGDFRVKPQDDVIRDAVGPGTSFRKRENLPRRNRVRQAY